MGESAAKVSSRHVRYVPLDINPDFVACCLPLILTTLVFFFYIHIFTNSRSRLEVFGGDLTFFWFMSCGLIT